MRCRYFVVWIQRKFMCMLNRKDDCAIFLILSCHQCPLCVCANRSVAKGQIRASPGRETAPQHHSFDPAFIQASASRRTLPLGSAFLPFGSLFEHINALIEIWLLSCRVPCVCSASGREKPKLGPFTQLLLIMNWSTIVYPSFMYLCFIRLLLS